MEIPRALGQAEMQMRGARGALQQGAPGEAADAQTQAVDAMQRGGQAMMQQLQEQMSQQQGEGPGGQTQPNGRRGRDPLGRAARNDGGLDTRGVQVPEESDLGRARDVLRGTLSPLRRPRPAVARARLLPSPARPVLSTLRLEHLPSPNARRAPRWGRDRHAGAPLYRHGQRRGGHRALARPRRQGQRALPDPRGRHGRGHGAGEFTRLARGPELVAGARRSQRCFHRHRARQSRARMGLSALPRRADGGDWWNWRRASWLDGRFRLAASWATATSRRPARTIRASCSTGDALPGPAWLVASRSRPADLRSRSERRLRWRRSATRRGARRPAGGRTACVPAALPSGPLRRLPGRHDHGPAGGGSRLAALARRQLPRARCQAAGWPLSPSWRERKVRAPREHGAG